MADRPMGSACADPVSPVPAPELPPNSIPNPTFYELANSRSLGELHRTLAGMTADGLTLAASAIGDAGVLRERFNDRRQAAALECLRLYEALHAILGGDVYARGRRALEI